MWIGISFALAAGLVWGLVFVAPLLLPHYPAALLSVGRYLAFGLIAAVSCRIEDYTPTGSRHDEEAVQSIVTRYARTLSDPGSNSSGLTPWMR